MIRFKLQIPMCGAYLETLTLKEYVEVNLIIFIPSSRVRKVNYV